MNVYHRTHRFDARSKEAEEHMTDNNGDRLKADKSISAWAEQMGVYPRTARSWYKRLGYTSDGTRIMGILKGKAIILTLEEWNRLQAEGKGVPGIKKGYKYKKDARSNTKADI